MFREGKEAKIESYSHQRGADSDKEAVETARELLREPDQAMH